MKEWAKITNFLVMFKPNEGLGFKYEKSSNSAEYDLFVRMYGSKKTDIEFVAGSKLVESHIEEISQIYMIDHMIWSVLWFLNCCFQENI